MNGDAKHPRSFLSAFTTLLFLNILVMLHFASVTYIHSSFLGRFFSPEHISILYTAASVVVVGVLLGTPRLAKIVGVWRLFIITTIVLQLAMFFLGFSKNALAAAIFFTVQGSLLFTLRYLLDLYVESISRNESRTGNTRGLFITAGSIGLFLGPLAASVIIVGSNFEPLYAFSALVLMPVFLVALGALRNMTPRVTHTGNVLMHLHDIVKHRPRIRSVMVVHFMMQIFSAAIVIYAPLYLFSFGNLSWQTIGSVTALALLPYLVLEIPLGFLADRAWGEKEIMIAGLVILGGAMVSLSFIPLSLFFLWSIVFIATRIGAAMVEIGTESYFFKQVTEADVEIISAFRALLPLGGVVAPLIALAVLPFIAFNYLFAVFGAIFFFVGIPFALRIRDTR